MNTPNWQEKIEEMNITDKDVWFESIEEDKGYKLGWNDSLNEIKPIIEEALAEQRNEVIDECIEFLKEKIRVKEYKLVTQPVSPTEFGEITIPVSYESAFELGRNFVYQNGIDELQALKEKK